jgi:hypothetical protein
MFKVSLASLQTFIDCLAADRQGQGDTSLTLTPSVIPNSNYVIIVSEWNCLKYFCVFLYCNHQVHRDFLITCITCSGTLHHTVQSPCLRTVKSTKLGPSAAYHFITLPYTGCDCLQITQPYTNFCHQLLICSGQHLTASGAYVAKLVW